MKHNTSATVTKGCMKTAYASSRINGSRPDSVFLAGAKIALVLRTRASWAPAGKPHDVRRIISTHSGGFVYRLNNVSKFGAENGKPVNLVE